MSMEGLWYEASPYVYFTAGATTLAYASSALGSFSGALLLLAAVITIGLRWSYRNKRREATKQQRRQRIEPGARPR